MSEITISTRVKLPSPRIVQGVEFPIDEVEHEAYIYNGRFFYWSTIWGKESRQIATLAGQADAPVPSDLGRGDDLNPPAWFVEQANKMRGRISG